MVGLLETTSIKNKRGDNKNKPSTAYKHQNIPHKYSHKWLGRDGGQIKTVALNNLLNKLV
jgi:hypothetical protein